MLFLKSGILTTIQDLGRNCHRSAGINPNGAMDKSATQLLNILLNNPENEGVLETHFPAPEILFEEECTIAIGGADFSPMINDKPIDLWKTTAIKVGDRLKFSKKNYGMRTYLAVSRGFEVDKWLDSVSTNLVAGIGKKIEKGDNLSVKNGGNPSKKTTFYLAQSLIPAYQTQKVIRIIVGNEYKYLDSESTQSLQNQYFSISAESNRMGYRLVGKSLKLNIDNSGSVLSSAVDFGTIQLLPSGQLIILMADHQTTGGYPRIGHVISADLPILAQLEPTNSFKFQIITVQEAQELLFLREDDFKKLKVGVKFKL